MSKKQKVSSASIAQNRKARHDYHLRERFEAGLALEGWEVKSLRAGKVQLVDSYVLLKNGEAYLLGTLITPLISASTHQPADPTRTRKLLLHREELAKIHQATQAKGMSCIPVSLYWKRQRVKCEIALAEGKKDFDKREDTRKKDWERQRARIMRNQNR